MDPSGGIIKAVNKKQKMTKEVEEDLGVGDVVKIVKHKFPELHPDKPQKKTVFSENIYKKEKVISYEYILSGLNYIGMEGKIIGVRKDPYTKYEIETGEIQKYEVQLLTKALNWKGRVTLWPEEIKKVS